MKLKQRILELKSTGMNNVNIAKTLKISRTTVLYHLKPNYREKNKQRTKEWFNKLTLEQREKYNISRREYNKKYQQERYANDLEFREKQKARARERKRGIKNVREVY